MPRGRMSSSAQRCATALDLPAYSYHNGIMRLIKQEVLVKAVRKHSEVRQWIASWVATVEDASWSSLDDVRQDYPSADGVTLKSRTVVTVFNVKGNEYRLVTIVNFANQFVQVLELQTHAEYDKNRWKERY